MLNKVEDYIKEQKISYKKNYIIKYDTYFKMGSIVKLFIMPNSDSDFKSILFYCHNNSIPYKILGFTSNVILLDEIEYTIIISTKSLTSLSVIDDTIEVEAGYSLQDFVRVAVMNQSKGFEGLEGIPASIGGAIFMNAGAYGYSISDNLLSVECINKNNKIVILKANECSFLYRDSIFKNGEYIIVKAIFKLEKGDRESIADNIEMFHIARHSYQDFVYPNLGSMLSISGRDTYSRILKDDRYFNALYWVFKYLYKNPLVKFFNRKKPNNKIFNQLLLRYLQEVQKIKIQYTLSSKSANILINDGTVNSKELVNYIFLIHELTDQKFKIENEIVLEPAHVVEKSFENEYKRIVKLKEERK